MRIWELTNKNGDTIRIKAKNISELPFEFGLEGEDTFLVTFVKLILEE